MSSTDTDTATHTRPIYRHKHSTNPAYVGGGSRPYSRAELDSLIPSASPTSLSRRARAGHSQRPISGSSYLFPDPTSRQPVLSTNYQEKGTIYDHALSVLPVLKYGRGICSINLHPSTQRDVAINKFLWKCAQAGEYDTTAGNLLLDVNVLVLSMSTELLKLLRRLTLEEFQGCVLDFLSLIDEDDDNDDYNADYHENDHDNIDDDDTLDPSTWIQLHNRIANSGRPQSRCENVETLARLCLLTPWKIPVYVTYVTPFDMHNSISISTSPNLNNNGNSNSNSNISINKAARIRSRAPSVGVVHWKLFMDWQRYRRLWVERIQISPMDASNTMMNAILTEQQHPAWAATETVLAASKRDSNNANNNNNNGSASLATGADVPSGNHGNLLALLPHDVLWNNLVPRVLYTQCQVEADT